MVARCLTRSFETVVLIVLIVSNLFVLCWVLMQEDGVFTKGHSGGLWINDAGHSGERNTWSNDFFMPTESLFDFLNEKFDGVNEKFDGLNQTVGLLRQELTGEQALKFANAASVQIEVTPATNRGNTMGCGTIVEIDGDLFVATNRHLFVCENGTHCRRHTKLSLLGGTLLQSRCAERWHKVYDLALIPIHDIPGVRGLKVLNHPPMLGTTLWSISNREHGAVMGICHVLEKKRLWFESNCGGTHGFSGTGYLNGAGELVGVHKGQGEFNHMEEGFGNVTERDEVLSFEYDWDATVGECTRPTNNGTLSVACLELLKTYIQVAARNPRTSVVPGYILHDLARQLKNCH
jgi:hypothetical protein